MMSSASHTQVHDLSRSVVLTQKLLNKNVVSFTSKKFRKFSDTSTPTIPPSGKRRSEFGLPVTLTRASFLRIYHYSLIRALQLNLKLLRLVVSFNGSTIYSILKYQSMKRKTIQILGNQVGL